MEGDGGGLCAGIYTTRSKRESSKGSQLHIGIEDNPYWQPREERAEQRLPISAFLYAQRELHVEWETHARSRRGIEM